jgi:hypothetical protein
MNTYSNKTHDKTTTKRTTKQTNKNNKKDHLRLFTLKYNLLKISVDLQTAFAAETHLADGATERGKVTYVPSRNTNADCFQDRGALFSAAKNTY